MLAAKWAQEMVNACCVGSAIWIASTSYLVASANLPSSARLMISQARLATGAVTVRPKYSLTHSVGSAARFSVAILATPTIVFQPPGKGLGLAEVLEHLTDFTELAQNGPQLETNLEGLFQCGSTIRQRLENTQSL